MGRNKRKFSSIGDIVGNVRRLVLIVDDEEINRLILGNIMGPQYQIAYAVDGVEALKFVQENYRNLSAVLLDLNMPNMDGRTLLKTMKADPLTSRIPVLVATGIKEEEVQCLQEGACDFFAKPYDMPEVLRARVANAIKMAEDSEFIEVAEKDALTGLYARDFFYRYCEQLDRNIAGEKDALALDIDRFKLINGLYGKAFGDKVLIKIAEILVDMVRKNNGLVCRPNADTFLIYQDHLQDYDAFVTQLNEAVLTRFDRAHIACEKAKDNYSHPYEVYDEVSHRQQLESQKYISAMEDALKQREFITYYQPKYDMTGDTPRLAGAEALVRWQSKTEGGMISPGKFIPLFEQNGLIYKLDLYIWEEVARQMKEWKEKYSFNFPISVNVSRVDLYSPNLLLEIEQIIDRHGLTFRDLALEITESVCAADTETILSVVRNLRDHGFKIEMDDFGSGYSSLNMLSRMPINVLKMDMKFFQRNAGNDEIMDAMIRLIIDFAKVMKVPVIAEGVEDKEQADYLKAIGCDMIQGYYFGRPMPAAEFEKLLQQNC